MDKELNAHLSLTSANSINVARFLPQSFYYFYAYAQLKKLGKADNAVFCVPSGNFGNITAGLFGKRMKQESIMKQGWDYITYLTDKQSTVPMNKMKEIFELVDTIIPKVQLLKWNDNVEGSLRNRNQYNERKAFLEQYLKIDCPMVQSVDLFGQEIEQPLSLRGKNIIVLDDQLTTGATA